MTVGPHSAFDEPMKREELISYTVLLDNYLMFCV